ncbi:hypothetical protein OEA41_005180 [Lepraria neglecta]|uniref:Uncharacterized protein n=1 Tax=Lepraria neglecta TaxID=209136 RepID=A0AAE0DFA7_9LECA|nr:hypothetical protein OEA41_005180 [Lepraria neglecta]
MEDSKGSCVQCFWLGKDCACDPTAQPYGAADFQAEDDWKRVRAPEASESDPIDIPKITSNVLNYLKPMPLNGGASAKSGDNTDTVKCQHCKKPVSESPAVSHVPICLEKKKEKARKKKETREAHAREAKAKEPGESKDPEMKKLGDNIDNFHLERKYMVRDIEDVEDGNDGQEEG